MTNVLSLERKLFQEDYAPGLSTGAVIEAENLFTNPSLELDAANWGTWAGNGGGVATIGRVGGGINGSSFIRMTWTTAPTSGGGLVASSAGCLFGRTLTKTERIYFNCWIRSTIAQTIQPNLQTFQGASASLYTTTPSVTLTANTWTQVSGFIDAVAGDDRVEVRFYATDAASVVWTVGASLDADSLYVGFTQHDYFDGSFTDVPGLLDYQWTGTAHASKSRLVIPEPILAENLLPNPGAEFNGGWALNSAVTHSRTFDTSIFRSGSSSVKSTKISGVTSAALSIYSAGLRDNNRLPILPNTTYYASAWVRPGQSNFRGRVAMLFYDATGASVSTTYGSYLDTPKEIWTRVSDKFTSPANAVSCYFQVDVNTYSGDAAIGDFAHVDDAILTIIPVTVDRISGDQDNAFWLGTPHQSRSRLIETRARDETFLERAYWAKRSGLPVATSSLADHQRAALILEHTPVVGDPSWVVAKNYIANPNFETDTVLWAANANGTITRDTAEKYSGTASLKFTSDGVAGQGGGYYQPSPKADWSLGDPVSARLMFKGAVGVNYQIEINCTGNFNLGSSSDGQPQVRVVTATGNWQEVKWVGHSILAGYASGPYVIVRTQSNAVASTYWIDEVALYKSATLPSFTAPNPVVNPGAEIDLTGWRYLSANFNFERDTSKSYKGVASFLCTVPSNTPSVATNSFGMAPRTNIPVKPGRTYRISMRVTGNGILTSANFAVFWKKADGSATTPDGYSSNYTLPSDGTWVEMVQTLTAPVDAASFQMDIKNSAPATTGAKLWIDDIKVEDQSPLNYFDGSDKYSRWLGTVNNSFSELTDPTKMTNADLLMSRYQAGSGLPKVGRSMMDHMEAFFKIKLGL